MKTIFYFLFLISINVMSCSDSSNPKDDTRPAKITSLNIGTNANLYGVFFENASKGYVVGDSGTVLSTTDGGANWTKIQTNFTYDLYATIVSNGEIYIGGKGILMFGDNIENINNFNKSGGSIYALSASSNNKIIAVGGFAKGNTTFGQCFIKNQSESTWTAIANSTVKLGEITILGKISDIIPIDSDNVIWSISTCNDMGNCLSGIRRADFETMQLDTLVQTNGIKGIYALSKRGSVCIGVGFEKIASSSDNGVTWSEQATPNGSILMGVAMVSSTIGFACGEGGVMYKTTDSGQTWSSYESGTTQNLFKIFFPTSTIGYAVGEGGTIIKIDLGNN